MQLPGTAFEHKTQTLDIKTVLLDSAFFQPCRSYASAAGPYKLLAKIMQNMIAPLCHKRLKYYVGFQGFLCTVATSAKRF